jgi:small subunit ribosomal protein S2
MAVIQMKALLEAGVHFGHQTGRWNPKMAPYIYTQRAGTHIIDLEKTSECIDQAYTVFKEIGELGGKVLFVGTKKQAQKVIQDEAIRCGHYYVNQRWLGGTLTNYGTIRKSVNKYLQYKQMEQDGTFEALPKQEVAEIRNKMARAEKFLGGILDMTSLPQAIFVIDPHEERTAVLEAKKLHIPVFGIVDTNCDPDDVDYVIPANDDAIGSLKLIVSAMANALIEGAGGVVEFPEAILAESGLAKKEEAPEEEVLLVEQVKVEEKPAEEEAKPKKKAAPKPKKEEKVEEPKAEEVKEEAPEEEVKVEEPQDQTYDPEWLAKQTVKDLKELAKARGLESSTYSKLLKADLVALLAERK